MARPVVVFKLNPEESVEHQMSKVAVAKALSHELSWKILELLTGGELTLAQIRKSLQVPTSSLKMQLENLADAGMITVQSKPLTSHKRVLTYRLTGVPKTVGFPPRDYFYLSESIINSLRDSLGEDGARMLLQDIGVRIGESAVESLVSRTGMTKWDSSTFSKHFVGGLLTEMGFQPEVVKLDRSCLVYHERNCLFEDLAVKYPGLVCDVLDKAVHEGIDKMAGTLTTRLSCKGHGDAVCEYSVVWRKRGKPKS